MIFLIPYTLVPNPNLTYPHANYIPLHHVVPLHTTDESPANHRW